MGMTQMIENDGADFSVLLLVISCLALGKCTNLIRSQGYSG